MSDLTVQHVSQTLTVKRGEPTALRIRVKEQRTVSVKATGLRGPQGERGDKGETGPMGPVGSFDDADLPDFSLIFENQFV